MKSKTTELVRAITILSLCILTSLVAAQGNPASVGYVNQAIATATAAIETYVNQAIAAVPTQTQAQVNQAIVAATTLTQTDWQAVCQSGNINSTNGCYGDAGSQAFAKINRLGGNPLGYAGVTGSAANSVWVRQVGVGTSCTTTDAQLRILNTAADSNSTLWICGTELTNGILFSTIAIGNMAGGSTEVLTNNALYFAGSTILPTVYVFCLSTTNTSAATAFAQAPGTSLNGTQC